MEFDFSKTDSPISTAIVALTTVYRINADSTYDVTKNLGKEEKEMIALRTVKGSGIVKIDGYAQKTVTENTLLFFEHNKVKRYFCEKEVWDFWWFAFSIAGALAFPINSILEIPVFSEEQKECQTCMELLRNHKSYSIALASSKLSALIYEWMYEYQYEKQKVSLHNELINNTINYLHTHLSGNITVKQMANNCGLSERRFREVFSEQVGKSPKCYYEELRMQMAGEYLRNTPLTIGEISEKLGYRNQFYFCRAFTKNFGVNPSHYRRI